jgi:WD40 repeat protein
MLRALILTSLAVVLLLAQQGSVEGPVSGYVFDSSAQGLRPILGVPGASLFGAPVDFGFAISSAYAAPRQDAAFVVAGDGSLHVFSLNRTTATEQSVSNLVKSPQRVLFSPSGTCAAIYAGGSVQVVTGLPNSATVSGGVDLPSGTVPDSLAVSDDGSVLLVSAGKAVWLYGSSNALGKLMDTAGPAMLAFASGGHDAAIDDPAGAGVVLFHDLTGAGSSQVLAAPDDTISASSALAFSADGKSLLLASSKGQSVTTIDLVAGARNAIACTCSPSTLARMGNMFRLTDLGKEPLWVLDPRSSAPRIVFVPALPATGPHRGTVSPEQPGQRGGEGGDRSSSPRTAFIPAQ